MGISPTVADGQETDGSSKNVRESSFATCGHDARMFRERRAPTAGLSGSVRKQGHVPNLAAALPPKAIGFIGWFGCAGEFNRAA